LEGFLRTRYAFTRRANCEHRGRFEQLIEDRGGGAIINLTTEDQRLLEELCEQHGVSAEKVLKMLNAVFDSQFKDRRTGVFDTLREILNTQIE
jgi:hypothetical protein